MISPSELMPQEMLKPSSDQELLKAFARTSEDGLFTELTQRYKGLAYGVAYRILGQPEQAREVAQAVFILLARKAHEFSDQTILSGWVFKTARFMAMDYRKMEARRLRREQMAAEQLYEPQEQLTTEVSAVAPVLDEALAALSASDRHAVLLRFFQNKSYAEVGESIGLNENSARVRVVRAVEKLGRFIKKKGIVLQSGSLLVILGSLNSAGSTLSPLDLSGSQSQMVGQLLRSFNRARFIKRLLFWSFPAAITIVLCWSAIAVRRNAETSFQTYLKRDSIFALDNAYSYGRPDRFIALTFFSGEDIDHQRSVLHKYLLAQHALRKGLRALSASQEQRGLSYVTTLMKLFTGQKLALLDSSSKTIVRNGIPGEAIQLIRINNRWLWDFSASFPGPLLNQKLEELESKTPIFNELAHSIEQGDLIDPRLVLPFL